MMHRIFSTRPWVLALLLASMIAAGAMVPRQAHARAAESWTIISFDARYVINSDGTVDAVEDIAVDFGSLEKHGIFRDIPIKYKYDQGRNRVIDIRVTGVTDGSRGWKYTTSNPGANLRIKIGDPDKTISGPQRYVISYRITGGLNPFPDHDELYLNVTGNDWEVTIQRATARVEAPALQSLTCFQGPTASTETCRSVPVANSASFTATRPMPPGSGLTLVVAMPKGAVNVAPLKLEREKTPGEEVKDFLGLKPLPLGLAALGGVAVFGSLGRMWWTSGRDRWYGDVQYLTQASRESTQPLFARETIVPEFAPPELPETKRRLRPAEVGVLMDERADTLDVSATIIDLAVRGYLRIEDLGNTGLLGLGGQDFQLERLRDAGDDLLSYERTLFEALFDEGGTVKLSELKNKFYEDLARVKRDLYEVAAKNDGLFPRSPEAVRTVYRVAGGVAAGAGAVAVFLLGSLGAGIIGLPLVLGGATLLGIAGLMPRRTARGRELYRRALGFREYMVTAETDRQRFAEEANIFNTYLPYAIVFRCTEMWAKRFEGLEGQPGAAAGGWYVSPYPFLPLAFAHNIEGFSSQVSSAIASTPGGSGGSGFGGGSGGGVGGGGGGSW